VSDYEQELTPGREFVLDLHVKGTSTKRTEIACFVANSLSNDGYTGVVSILMESAVFCQRGGLNASQ